MSFWWWAGCMLVAALGFVLWPLVAKRPRGAAAVQQVAQPRGNADLRAIYRDRLAELDEEVAAGQLDPTARAAVADEIGAALLADHGAAPPDRVAAVDAPAPLFAATLGAALVLVALAVYWQVGEPRAGDVQGAEIVLRLNPDTDAVAIGEWRGRLRARVAARPEDAQSWYLLAHTHLQLQDFAPAAEAFARAHALVGNDPSIDVYWLQARYLAARGEIDATTRQIADRLLQQRPNHPLVLEMLAIDAYRRSDFRQAVAHLDQALAGPLSDNQRLMLQRSFEQAREALGELMPAIDLQVDTASAAPAQATLFVIARPVAGGMPYAVVRRPAGTLPLDLRLDDAVAMNPARPLSQAETIQLVVRLSLSGAAMAQPGDWEWISEPIGLNDLPAQPLQVELAPPENS